MKILIATHNTGKLGEISSILNGLPVELISLQELGIKDDVEETGTSHQENALIKAKFFAQKTKLPTLGEDSGIHVDALSGELGVATRRFRGLEKATDEAWIEHFMRQMENVPDKERGAKFICHAAFVYGDEIIHFSGETRGFITRELRAPLKKGIPLSSCFVPKGFLKVYAELSDKEKASASHRGKAIGAFKDFLAERFKNPPA